jgi:hypothetical protein
MMVSFGNSLSLSSPDAGKRVAVDSLVWVGREEDNIRHSNRAKRRDQ